MDSSEIRNGESRNGNGESTGESTGNGEWGVSETEKIKRDFNDKHPF